MSTDLGKKISQIKLDRTDTCKAINAQGLDILPDQQVNYEDKNLGDVDILILNKTQNKVCLFECKDISSGRNTKEIASEIKNLFEGEKSYLNKHLRRVDYFAKNRDIIAKRYSITNTYRLFHCFVVSEMLPAMMLHQHEAKFITFLELAKNPDIFSPLTEQK